MDIIFTYFPDLNSRQADQFRQLDELYRSWNEKINVVSRKDIDHLDVHHVLHSLAIAKVIQFKAGTKILDVGTGGGFPGIPLAILFPECRFHLVDSIGKKIKVVTEIAKELGLTNVHAEQIRAENLKRKYDFVVSRAVTALPEFYSWVRNKIEANDKNALPNGILALKGGNIEGELADFRKRATVYTISDFFQEEFFETKKVVYLQG